MVEFLLTFQKAMDTIPGILNQNGEISGSGEEDLEGIQQVLESGLNQMMLGHLI